MKIKKKKLRKVLENNPMQNAAMHPKNDTDRLYIALSILIDSENGQVRKNALEHVYSVLGNYYLFLWYENDRYVLKRGKNRHGETVFVV